jgi:hypothetical protein
LYNVTWAVIGAFEVWRSTFSVMFHVPEIPPFELRTEAAMACTPSPLMRALEVRAVRDVATMDWELVNILFRNSEKMSGPAARRVRWMWRGSACRSGESCRQRYGGSWTFWSSGP